MHSPARYIYRLGAAFEGSAAPTFGTKLNKGICHRSQSHWAAQPRISPTLDHALHREPSYHSHRSFRVQCRESPAVVTVVAVVNRTTTPAQHVASHHLQLIALQHVQHVPPQYGQLIAPQHMRHRQGTRPGNFMLIIHYKRAADQLTCRNISIF